MSERRFGYGIILLLIAFLLIPLYYLLAPHRKPEVLRTVVFSSANTLNFLKTQDPVRIRGFAVGEVKTVALDHGMTMVTIALQPQVRLHAGYRATTVPSGFMGDRCLDIEPGDPCAPDIGNREMLIGNFLKGPVEVVSATDSLKRKIAALSDIAHTLRSGSGATPPLATRFRCVEKILDSNSRALELLLRRADGRLGGALDSMNDVIKKTGRLSGELAVKLPADESRIAGILATTESSFQSVDSLITAIRGVASRGAPGLSPGLSASLDSLRSLLSNLRDDCSEIRRGGMNMRVRL
jgi:ABC-type transporter Mla subunit MlaD